MRAELLATGAVLTALNCLDVGSLSKRILLQKKMYLFQYYGVDLGYRYSWYIHGPYSAELTAAAYECVSMEPNYYRTHKIKSKISETIKKINQLEHYIGKNDIELSVVSWYELLASYCFWFEALNDKDAVKDKIRSAKPQFSEQDIESAENALSALQYCEN